MSQPLNQTSAPAAGANSDKLKEKIGKYIKDLEDLKLGYDINDIQEEIEWSYEISKSTKETLKVTYNVLLQYFQDAKEKTWLLSKAYNNDATGSMLTNAVGLYTDLIIINALRKFIDSYDLETEPRFASPTFIDFTGKTKDVLSK